MKTSITILSIVGISFILSPMSSVSAYNEDTCCELAKQQNAFIGEVPALDDQKCYQNYSQGLPAAPPLYVDYRFCSSNCRGMGLSKASQPSQWAAPIVQFILPSVIFSMTIPRRKKIDFGYLLDFRLHTRLRKRHPRLDNTVHRAVYLILFLFILIPVIIDTMIWIFIIMVGAGNMIAAGILESHLDYRTLRYCKDKPNDDENDKRIKRGLLTTVVAGNLCLEKGEPQETILKGLMLHDNESATDGNSQSRLLNLLEAQASFGGAVGSPVLFFLGAFIYTILDLKQDPSSEDSAISLGYGIEWMNIVNVAIVSGCLLAANNPSTSAGIAGASHEALEDHQHHPSHAATFQTTLRDGDKPRLHPSKWNRKDYLHHLLGWSDAYETEFQPVSLWHRGTNKMKWLKRSEAWRADPDFQRRMKITRFDWIFKAFAPTFLLVALPPASGSVVAYYFPPRGLGCRCLSFMIYGVCQALISAISVYRNAVEVEDASSHPGWLVKGLYLFLWLASFFSAVGGTTMQVVGVFRNCVCASLANYWVNIRQKNPSINLATDTQDARDASDYWIMMGTLASVFVGSVTYVAWWYQKIVRHRFTEAVRDLKLPSSNSPSTSVGVLEPVETANQRLLDKYAIVSLTVDPLGSGDIGRLRPDTASPSRDSMSRSGWSIRSSTEYLLGRPDRREEGTELSPI